MRCTGFDIPVKRIVLDAQTYSLQHQYSFPVESLIKQDEKYFVYDIAIDVKKENAILDIQTRTDFILPDLQFKLKSVNSKGVSTKL